MPWRICASDDGFSDTCWRLLHISPLPVALTFPTRVSVYPLPLAISSQLVQTNLTTNEHRRLGRVDYLLDPNESGQYFNPFDQGCFKNCLARLTGTYDRPPSDLVTRLRGGEGSDIEMASFV